MKINVSIMSRILLIIFCLNQQASIIQSLTAAFHETQEQQQQLVSNPMYQSELLSKQDAGEDISQFEGNSGQRVEQQLQHVYPGKFFREKASLHLFSNTDLNNYPLKPTVYQYVKSCCNREVMRPMGGGHMTGPCCAQLIKFNYFIRLSYKWFKEVLKKTNRA